jgi:signal peptidase I
MLRALAAALALSLLVGCSPENLAQIGETYKYAAGHPNAALVRFRINSTDMAPTYRRGDVLLVDMRAYSGQFPRRGDVVVLDQPGDSTGMYVKRVIAVPGDRVTIGGGRLYLNGKLQHEEYVRRPIDYGLRIHAFRVSVREPGDRDWIAVGPAFSVRLARGATLRGGDSVPYGYCMVLGDNRNDSEDAHVFGFIEQVAIRGKVVEKL